MIEDAMAIELLSPAEMGRADALAVEAGRSDRELMGAAGRRVAERVMLRCPAPGLVAVLCGPGNNGGDGFVAALLLRQHGYRVRVGLLGKRDDLKGEAAQAAAEWGGAEPASTDLFNGAAVIVDALFGAGLDRPVTGKAAALIAAMNASAATVVAVDLPSGLNGQTGLVLGTAVKATETVTFFRRKPGHLLFPGRVLCGPVHVTDIGVPAAVLDAIRPSTFVNAPPLWRTCFRRHR